MDKNFNDLETVFTTDSEVISQEKSLALDEFKKIHKGGYLGYTNIYSFGDISEFFDAYSYSLMDKYLEDLGSKIIVYLKEKPENITYSILPVLR